MHLEWLSNSIRILISLSISESQYALITTSIIRLIITANIRLLTILISIMELTIMSRTI